MPVVYIFLALLLGGHTAAADSGGNYQITPCPFEFAAAQCGTATLPENRSGGSGRVHIPVVQLGGDANDDTPPAIILGGGGPGGNLQLDNSDSIHFWDSYRRRILGDDGRLILIDQRGSGLAKPLLNCPEEKPLFLASLQNPLPMRAQSKKLQAVLQQCQKRLLLNGVQLAAYTTSASADDIEDIRRLLDIEQWYLIGYSYATRLALEVIRRHPHGVAAAVLDSPFPYDAATLPPFYSFASLISSINTQCNEQQGCRRHGDVADNIKQVMADSRQTSLAIDVRYEGKHYAIALSPLTIIDMLYVAMYSQTGVAALPFFSRQLAAGETDSENARFYGYHYLDFNLDKTFATMLNWTINCSEGRTLPPLLPQSVLEEYEYNYMQEYLTICEALQIEAASPSVVSTDKPILVINGSYDVATPSDWGTALAKRLPNAQRLVSEDVHVSSVNSPCIEKAIYSFFRAPSAKIMNYCSDERLIFY